MCEPSVFWKKFKPRVHYHFWELHLGGGRQCSYDEWQWVTPDNLCQVRNLWTKSLNAPGAENKTSTWGAQASLPPEWTKVMPHSPLVEHHPSPLWQGFFALIDVAHSVWQIDIITADWMCQEPRIEPWREVPRPLCHLTRLKWCLTHPLLSTAHQHCGRGFLL